MTIYTTVTAQLSDDGETRERVTFSVHEEGGYVWYQRPGMPAPRQLCARALPMGETLSATGRTLQACVRRALRQARYDNARRER